MNTSTTHRLIAALTIAACPAQELGDAWGTAGAEAAYYRIVELPVPRELALEAGSFCMLPDGRLAIGTRRGEILLVAVPKSGKTKIVKIGIIVITRTGLIA